MFRRGFYLGWGGGLLLMSISVFCDSNKVYIGHKINDSIALPFTDFTIHISSTIKRLKPSKPAPFCCTGFPSKNKNQLTSFAIELFTKKCKGYNFMASTVYVEKHVGKIV